METKICKRCAEVLPLTQEFFRHQDKRFRNACRACERKAERERYALNREDKLKRCREYYHTHLDKARLRSRLKNRRDAQKYKTNHRDKENRNEYARIWRRNHPEQAAKHTAKWRRKNVAHVKALSHNRRAREMAAKGSWTKDDISKLYELQKGRCWWCGKKIKKMKFHVDHRVPLAKGGNNSLANIVISCPHCNLSKHDKMPSEFIGKLL